MHCTQFTVSCEQYVRLYLSKKGRGEDWRGGDVLCLYMLIDRKCSKIPNIGYAYTIKHVRITSSLNFYSIGAHSSLGILKILSSGFLVVRSWVLSLSMELLLCGVYYVLCYVTFFIYSVLTYNIHYSLLRIASS